MTISTEYEYKLKLLETQIAGEFKLMKKELLAINCLLTNLKMLYTKACFYIISCLVTALFFVIFEFC